METKLDPVSIVPGAVWDQVLNRLDPETLSVARAVSRDWNERASRRSLKREDAPVHATVNQVQAIHTTPLWFFLSFWHLAVHRTTFLFDYVDAFQEVARARVLVVLRVSAVLLVLALPLALGTPALGSGMLVQGLEVALLILPGFVKLPPRVADALLLLVTMALVRLDGPDAAARAPLPLLLLLIVATVAWSLFAQRLPFAIDPGSTRVASRLPLFFAPMSLPVRSLRFVAWVLSAMRAAPLWMIATCAVAAAAAAWRGRTAAFAPLHLAQFVVVAGAASLVAQLLQWQLYLVGWAETTLLVSLIAWNLSNLPAPWFERSALMHARKFRALSLATVLAYAALLIARHVQGRLVQG